ncbi:MAG: S8 family serine peptidase [Cenarchaeum sp. SB0665_bin_23]|nr:S8 family serine peptidase [Cenarchaeum sp. SB0665_bin_23]MYG33182.1 S8 family serine peptidase [Cenarchaeum sp. SB0677_bin_16]
MVRTTSIMQPYFLASIALITMMLVFAITQLEVTETHLMPYLEKSVPYIGAVPTTEGLDGNGILVAVIDTGIDYTHPDMLGFGQNGKVVGGFNFINPNQLPIDTNGHGTQVAGIIGADGGTNGVAPAVRLLSYKVSEDGEGVRSELIVSSIQRAIEDGADIINISLGVNKTNDAIDGAIAEAVERGVIVVVAAGNDGAQQSSIGSPGRSPPAITVGATYNNLTSSSVAILNINDVPYVAIPMVGSAVPPDPIESRIVYAGYARESDFNGLDVTDAVVLAERGSDKPGELLYFSIKEKNAADAGAAAIIIFNNKEGMYYGELIHNYTEPGYTPRIPAVSMSNKDGLKIINLLPDAEAHLMFLHDPDHVAPFSSRGPTLPFIKPDMMAPGVHINTTTLSGGYQAVSGTSYATPHVTGAVALLLQQHPSLTIEEIRSILTSTSSSVIGQEGSWEDPHNAGSGRLDVQAALATDLVVYPSILSASITPLQRTDTIPVHLRTISGDTLERVSIHVEPDNGYITHEITNDTVIITVDERLQADARLTLTYNNISHVIPIKVHHSNGTIHATQENGGLNMEVSYPEKWDFAKITLSSRSGETYETSVTPSRGSFVKVFDSGIYNMQAEISVGTQSYTAYDSILVDAVSENKTIWYDIIIPWRQVIIIAVLSGILGVFVVFVPRRSRVFNV